MADKFLRYKSYTKLEFMETCKNLLETEGIGPQLRTILNANLEWAEKLSDNVTISFKDGPNKSILPIAS